MRNHARIVAVVLVIVLLGTVPPVSAQGGPTLRDVVRAADLSPEGTLIALGGEQGVWIYDTRTLDAEPRLLAGHTRPVEHVAFSPDGHLLASSAASPEDTIYLWNADTGEQLVALYPSDPNTPQEDHPTALDFTNGFLVSGHQSGYIWFWNINPASTKIGTPISVFRADSAVVGLDAWLDLVTFHAPQRLYFWQEDGAIELSRPSMLRGGASLPLVRDGTHISYESLLTRMDGLHELNEAIRQHGSAAAALCTTSEPSVIISLSFAVGGADGNIALFDLGNGTALGGWQASDAAITTLAYDKACQRLLTLDAGGQVALWDVPTQTAIAFQPAG